MQHCRSPSFHDQPQHQPGNQKTAGDAESLVGNAHLPGQSLTRHAHRPSPVIVCGPRFPVFYRNLAGWLADWPVHQV